MKKILFGLVLALLASVSLASQTTLFKGSSGDNWPAFEKDLKDEGKLKDGAFPTAVLAQTAHNYAKEVKLPQAALGEKEFRSLFLLANNFGDTITVAEFRQLGQAGKIVLPDLIPRTATMATEVPATPVAQAPVAPAANAPVYGGTFSAAPVGPPDGKLAVALTNMESQVKTLQEEVAKSGSNQKEVAALKAQLSVFQGELKALKEGQGGFATKADIDAAREMFTTLKGQVDGLSGLRDQVNGLDGRVGGVEGRLSTVEGSTILAMGNKLFAAFGLFLLIVGILAFIFRKHTNDGMTEVKDELKVVKGIVTTALGTAQKADTQSAAAVTKVTAVEGEVKRLAGRREVTFPFDFDARVDGLTEVGQKCHLMVTVEDDRECQLAISLRSDSLYDIAGIQDLTTGVSRKALKKTIGNAAAVIDGESRLQGIALKSVDSIQPAPEPVSEEPFVLPSTDAIPSFLRKAA